MQLYNKLSKEEAIKQLEAETFKRRTISFYRYVILKQKHKFMDDLFRRFKAHFTY